MRQQPPIDRDAESRMDKVYRDRWRQLLHVDHVVDSLFETLQRVGVADDTYVIYTSDNGFHLGSFRAHGGKSFYLHSDLHVPLYVTGPGIRPHTSVRAITSTVDLAPTIVDLAGGAPRGNARVSSARQLDFEGDSLAPLLLAATDDERRKHRSLRANAALVANLPLHDWPRWYLAANSDGGGGTVSSNSSGRSGVCISNLVAVVVKSVFSFALFSATRAIVVQRLSRADSLFETLQRVGVADDTYVIYTSDNGFHLGSFRAHGGKSFYLHSDLHVPLYVTGPGIRPHTSVRAITSTVDLAPTIVDLAGGAPRGNARVSSARQLDFEGDSLAPLLLAATDDERRKHRSLRANAALVANLPLHDWPRWYLAANSTDSGGAVNRTTGLALLDNNVTDNPENLFRALRIVAPGRNWLYVEFADAVHSWDFERVYHRALFEYDEHERVLRRDVLS
eukprot:CAMPEP_0198370682 /NCGR_PEP_ID=MMETSP1450-20131203/156832_1 /TAXON_ID=753684 ORGANISM="Madagascaria erythrocladiodes, Strain CCMP3234" /NCGR_SAMPLE_ID=MMETSP1450 /ASSEMBLY_ACC=CAM_ASM_001115 /LENGTH=449 /DNA_ID=CAMNT_0044078225 /DNA_START=595 /DNA_END=1943 /DNA_ORIENTATION=+